ncbi:MAG TPA: SCP2 sterol-binding domain-containing protein [Fontimonas sp.]
MSAPALLCGAVEVALNRFLALEDSALRECAQLSPRVIELRTQAPDWSFFIEFHGAGVRVAPDCDRTAEVRVSGRMSNLMRLAWTVAQSGGDTGVPQGLQVDGDVELLLRFNRLLARIGFDPEEFAARIVGDAAGHRLTQGLRGVLAWGQRTVNTLGLDSAEYLREETRDLARASDAQEWAESVDKLRDDVARFEARLQRLERQVHA